MGVGFRGGGWAGGVRGNLFHGQQRGLCVATLIAKRSLALYFARLRLTDLLLTLFFAAYSGRVTVPFTAKFPDSTCAPVLGCPPPTETV
jgi:hypothetical protein